MKLSAMLAAVAVTLSITPALANRTFVSGKGADSGACAVTAPCRSFAYALTQTTVSGEVVVLDSAGYGPLSITQAVSISNPDGIEAGVSVPSGGTGITINAPGARVDLRGLTVDGQGVGATGIAIVAAQDVNIVNAVVRNLTTIGIAVNAGQVVISNAFVSNTGTGVGLTSAVCCSLIDGSTITDNSVQGVISQQSQFGDQIRNTTVTHNAQGVTVNAGSTLALLNTNCFANRSVDVVNNGFMNISGNKIVHLTNNTTIASYGNYSIDVLSGAKPLPFALQ